MKASLQKLPLITLMLQLIAFFLPQIISAQPCSTSIVPSGTTTFCAGGSVVLDAGSGFTGYQWNAVAGNATTRMVTATTSGTYVVTVTDALSCTASASIVVTVNTNPSGSISGTVSGVCEGQNINVTAIGGVSYNWGGPGGYSSSGANLFRSGATPAMSGIYIVTITNSNGCTSAISTNITVHPLPPANIAGNIDYCTGDTINLTASGGVSYNWNGPGGFNTTTASVNRTNCTLDMAGTYTVTVTSADGCTATASRTLTINTAPSAGITGSPDICVGGIISLTASGGGTYVWSGPGGFSANTATITRSSATVLMSGNYVVTVTGSNGCTTAQTVVVNVQNVTASITGATGYCVGATITLTAAGGGVGSTYAWSGPGGFTASAITMTRSSATLGMAGTYSVTVTGVGGCTATASVNVTVGSTFTPTITGSTTYCEGGTIGLTASGGSTYVWSGPGGFSSSGAAMNRTGATVAMAGTYTVTATNASGCTATASRSVTVNSAPAASISGTTAYCQGNTISLTASGGGTYNWSGPGGFSSTNTTITRTNANLLMAGTYIVTVTSSGCSATTSVNVTVTANPTASITGTSAFCTGSTISLTASGGTAYAWSGPGGFSSTDATFERPDAATGMGGTYTVTVTNSAGCSTTASKFITINTSPTANISGSINYCVGNTIGLTASGGTSYSWSGPGGFTAGSATITRTGATVAMTGVYTVTVTATNGCTATNSRTVTVNARPTVSAVSNSPVCVGSSINLSASGGVNYSWSGPSLYSSSLQNPVRTSATVAMSGTYNVTVTDSNGCTNTASTSVSVNNGPFPTAGITNNSGTTVLSCAVPSISLTATGGVSYL
ncbi:MAG TPA: hypothetical protein PK715_12210, partial [Chitinophagales bacterium]|nr:hypothetical protein [Chitinophagales bacterium]